MTTKKVISQFGGMWDILYVAHSAMKRDAGGKPTKTLDVWMESVADVEVGEGDPNANHSNNWARCNLYTR